MKTPSAPDPVKTAQAQAGMNVDTAQAQQLTNMVNQVGPDGSLTYSRGADNSYVDSQGKTVTIPQYTATTSFSPGQQAIYDKTQGAQSNLAGLAQDQSAFLQDYMKTPFSFDNQDAANWAYDLGSERLDPRFAREEDAMRTSLKNSGIQEGSEAWNAELGRLGESKNDAYNQLQLTGRSQAFSEALAGRNQPLNEITALMSGSQIAAPTFGATPQAGVGGVDYTGLVSDQYKAETSSQNAAMGGLFGVAAALPGMFSFSDENLKENIEEVGETDNGLPVYTYNYKGDDKPQVGLIAQDVQKKAPDAVKRIAGYLAVDYDKALRAA